MDKEDWAWVVLIVGASLVIGISVFIAVPYLPGFEPKQLVIDGFYGTNFGIPNSTIRVAALAEREPNNLVALVKGSIYGSGENMTVYGTCVDNYDIPVVGSTGNLSVWFPNGTLYLENQTMDVITDGYFRWTGNMPIVQGTYLTEFKCINGSSLARAWGEWQNPAWVNQIGLILNMSNETLNITNNTYVTVTEINTTVNQVNVTINQINTTVNNVNSTVNITLALLQYLINLTLNISSAVVPTCSNLTWVEYDVTDPPRYWTDWSIKVKVYGNGTLLESPDSYCTINTTETALTNMTVQGDHFNYTEQISMPPSHDWNWTTTCYCIV